MFFERTQPGATNILFKPPEFNMEKDGKGKEFDQNEFRCIKRAKNAADNVAAGMV